MDEYDTGIKSIYCKDCTNRVLGSTDLCKIGAYYKNGSYSKIKYYSTCSEKNKNNNCDDYKPRFLKKIINIIKVISSIIEVITI